MSKMSQIQETDEIQEEKSQIVREEKSNTAQFGEKQSILSYASCRLCPRECKVNRFKGER